MSRRALIAGVAGLAAYGLPAPAAAQYLSRVARRQNAFEIRPRSDWAGTDRPPKSEPIPEDVQLLVVHHTLIPGNGYREDQVAKLFRDIYDFHTGPEKGWPDIAYNFMVDQFGGIWEAREGSLDGPVRGSATGGNQGFSQLCCFMGDLSNQPPTEEATAAMAWLLAQLADRYDIDTSPGATVTLESLGSTRFAPGEEMTLSTMSGHRDVSLTACPGDAGYAFLQQTLPGLVNAQRSEIAEPTTTTTTTVPSTVATTTPPTTGEPPTTVQEESAASDNDALDDTAGATSGDGESGDDDGSTLPLLIGGAALAIAGAGIVAVAKRSLDDEDDDADGSSTEIAASLVADDEREDGTINLPTRLGLDAEVPDAFVPGPPPEQSVSERATAIPVPPPALRSTPEGPQRVWWAVANDASTYTEKAVEELTQDIQFHATHTPKDPEIDRMEWSRLDSLLAKRAHQTTAAIVAARSNAVFVLRSEPCLVVVTTPDGIEKRDRGREALSIERGDVARIAVHFDSEDSYPDIEVTAN
ncbi:MAG: N-acetylmuramoyl-L-alanine amidase [Acidimicrobiales bacterium]